MAINADYHDYVADENSLQLYDAFSRTFLMASLNER